MLIATSYLDTLAAQVNDDLQVSNDLKFADLAIKYELPTSIVTQVGRLF